MRELLERLNNSRLAAYIAEPGRLREDFGIEATVLAGGYGYRQILELVQNGADAILEESEMAGRGGVRGRLHVLLTESHLYVANSGAPLSEEGIDALLRSHSSPKRGAQIGRFGLGFKSLLRLGGCIDVFTRSGGAIRFDPDRCRRELKAKFNVPVGPALRLAWPIDAAEKEADGTLGSLGWAETIVRVEVRVADTLEHLRSEIKSFPAEFLLFFPVQTELTLEEGSQPARTLSCRRQGSIRVLKDGEQKSRWLLASRNVEVSDPRALADATHIHARDTVPLSWAVPMEGRREEAGRFWAFFPTHTPTYVPGILNAPWKLNSDRNAIIGGEWNALLMVESARLISDTLPQLATADDPARPIDAFPRQLERKDEDAAPLVEALWHSIEQAEVIPDAAGVLRPATAMLRHARGVVGLCTLWQGIAGEGVRSGYVHPLCLERQRDSRLSTLAERLSRNNGPAGRAGLRPATPAEWFASVATSDAAGALEVLKLAEAYAGDCKAHEWAIVRRTLAIIPSRSGELVTASQAILVPDGMTIPGRTAVSGSLFADAAARRILEGVLGVQVPGDTVWMEVLEEALSAAKPRWESDPKQEEWKSLWAKLRRAPAEVRDQFVPKHQGEIRVRRRDGKWARPTDVLLPGGIVTADDLPGNQAFLYDEEVHARDAGTLRLLGVRDLPDGVGRGAYDTHAAGSRVLWDWLDAARTAYKETHKNRASREYLGPNWFSMPNGFRFLPNLEGAANARLTATLLRHLSNVQHKIDFGHQTSGSYAAGTAMHPLLWLLHQFGAIQVGPLVVPLRAFVARRDLRWVLDLPGSPLTDGDLDSIAMSVPGVEHDEDDLHLLWQAITIAHATAIRIDPDSLCDLWAAAGDDGYVPDEILDGARSIPIEQVVVTTSRDLAQRARGLGSFVVTLHEDTMAHWLDAGARDLASLIEPQWSPVSPVQMLADTMPELLEVLVSDASARAICQPVSGLSLRLLAHTEPVPCLLWKGVLLMDGERLSRLPRSERFQRVLTEIAPAGWLNRPLQEAVHLVGDARCDALRAQVANAPTLAARLLLAVGGRREPLLDVLGEIRAMKFVTDCSTEQLAGLALAQLGTTVLYELRPCLSQEGLNPPPRWTGSEARTFVASLGFPEDFAIAPESRREAEEHVTGPIALPPLHDFQNEVMSGLADLLSSSRSRRRAVVSLPTGGGKTRVAVESAVRLVLEPQGTRRSVVWIAQTDELCEQAVQAFRQVWVNLGAKQTNLRIVRLWGGNPTPAVQDPDRPIVVVASIQTLNSRIGNEGLAWLSRPGLVIVDECHHAITPSYTNLLRWLDAEAPRAGAAPKEEAPIIGLSATPFRVDEDESARLARRFDNRWLPHDQEALHVRLVAQGVLAQAEYQALRSKAKLSPEDLDYLGGIEKWEGLEFERFLESLNHRLANDQARNELIIETVRKSGRKSILLFANSVAHALELSARLNLDGIPAAAISGATPAGARRHFLESFQLGKLRVLCNHSVLTTGFDAPKTDLVLISRQVFSPVRYMQMVGRGLRGPKNGGKAACRIVTVLDNLGRFQEKHPFHYCQANFGAAAVTAAPRSP